ncbi:twin-arginine translocation pathway signal [Amylibacter kogurei]|uniref:Twin-arginine translocation pathway signal n=1 Tax=Paramylibacter kogurei TaxID=1889778 RepID=A0A2G5KC20_9RHOB|nr:DUF1513 domain-containing protein [Amylibacter kogurei]PIB26709.1 twin-arginine translocation pathway signal [Amylibacter kogurei]
MTNRRLFLAGLISASTTPRLTWADAGNPTLLAAAKEPSGTFALFGLDDNGGEVFRIPLPDRGHAACAHPTAPEAVGFARRPGNFALVIDCTNGDLIKKLEAPAGRHFYGHGTFVENGAYLCTTENDYEHGQGVIGVWSRAQNYRRIGEITSGGIGPHEICTMPDDQTLVVANGGLKTHPDHGREILNLDDMQPNISYLKRDGHLIAQMQLDDDFRKNSIRHMDVRADGLVAFGMQWQGDETETPPLVGTHQIGKEATLFDAPFAQLRQMKNYIGSVAFSGDGTQIGATSPRGNKVQIYDVEVGLRAMLHRSDACGIATDRAGFKITDGGGGVYTCTGGDLVAKKRHALAWDNHLVNCQRS